MERGKIFTVPNSISLSRLLLALAFVVITGRWQRLVLIAAASATDFLDGWMARRANSSTVAELSDRERLDYCTFAETHVFRQAESECCRMDDCRAKTTMYRRRSPKTNRRIQIAENDAQLARFPEQDRAHRFRAMHVLM